MFTTWVYEMCDLGYIARALRSQTRYSTAPPKLCNKMFKLFHEYTVKNIWKSYIWTADKDMNESDPRSDVHYLGSSEFI